VSDVPSLLHGTNDYYISRANRTLQTRLTRIKRRNRRRRDGSTCAARYTVAYGWLARRRTRKRSAQWRYTASCSHTRSTSCWRTSMEPLESPGSIGTSTCSLHWARCMLTRCTSPDTRFPRTSKNRDTRTTSAHSASTLTTLAPSSSWMRWALKNLVLTNWGKRRRRCEIAFVWSLLGEDSKDTWVSKRRIK